jgi:NAD(P) transhydrogenase
MNASESDLVVIGSGPAGQKGAIWAAKARKRVAVIDWPAMIDGVSVHTGTIPSQTMREAIFQLTGFAVKTLSGNGFRNHDDVSVRDVSSRVSAIVARETELIRDQLTRNTIVIYQGSGRGVRVEASKILIACGPRPAHSPEIPFDNHRVVDTDHLADLGGLPREIIVVGAGVVGLEYASFMAVWAPLLR